MNSEKYNSYGQYYDSEEIDLTQFDDDYSEAEIEEHDYDPIPDGKYQVNIEEVELTRAKTSGKPMLMWKLRVLGPTFQGKLLWKNNVVGSPENIKWFKTDLHICGLDLDKFSELRNNLEQLIDVKVEVTKKTRGDNENVYINKRIMIEENDGEHKTVMPEDQVPF